MLQNIPLVAYITNLHIPNRNSFADDILCYGHLFRNLVFFINVHNTLHLSLSTNHGINTLQETARRVYIYTFYIHYIYEDILDLPGNHSARMT